MVNGDGDDTNDGYAVMLMVMMMLMARKLMVVLSRERR